MPLYKFLTTRIGSYTVETLNTKAQPQRIPSSQEVKRAQRAQAKRQRLHNKVLCWVEEHLDEEAKANFFGALRNENYDAAYAVLQDSWNSNTVATFYQRDIQWPKWRSNLKRDTDTATH